MQLMWQLAREQERCGVGAIIDGSRGSMNLVDDHGDGSSMTEMRRLKFSVNISGACDLIRWLLGSTVANDASQGVRVISNKQVCVHATDVKRQVGYYLPL